MSLAVNTPLIPQHRLKSARRVLFMSHLAIGDYLYQGIYLKALMEQYPHLTLDVWFDDLRERPKAWHAGRNQTLCQWLQEEPYLHELYPIAESKAAREDMIVQAKSKNYDLVFFIATQRTDAFAKVARHIAPNGFVAGTRATALTKVLPRMLPNQRRFQQLDGFFDIRKTPVDDSLHISDIYRRRFEDMLGSLTIDGQAHLPVNIPASYTSDARALLAHAHARLNSANARKPLTLFINHLSTSKQRNYPWPALQDVLIKLSKQHPGLLLVINVPPGEWGAMSACLGTSGLSPQQYVLFTADQHFYQLPAMIAACDLIVTVETAVMHLASALEVPQLVLMRESAMAWRPLRADSLLLGKKQVAAISTRQVVEETSRLIATISRN